jgi:hypothetical protein
LDHRGLVNNVSETEHYGKTLAGGKIPPGETFCNKRRQTEDPRLLYYYFFKRRCDTLTCVHATKLDKSTDPVRAIVILIEKLKSAEIPSPLGVVSLVFNAITNTL